MSMHHQEIRPRWHGLAGAAAVIVTPIALIAATWEPLEPPPRADRPARAEPAATPEQTREERGARRRDGADEQSSLRPRDREQQAPEGRATPRR